MIKLRTLGGKLIESPDLPAYVEICDKAGNPAIVFYQPTENMVSQLMAGTSEFNTYTSRIKSKESKVIDLQMHHENVFKELSNS
jgi:hypothetical protein